MTRIVTEERARQLAKAIVGDIRLYNAEAVANRADMTDEIAEGRAHFRQRTAPQLFEIYEQTVCESGIVDNATDTEKRASGPPTDRPSNSAPPQGVQSAALLAALGQPRVSAAGALRPEAADSSGGVSSAPPLSRMGALPSGEQTPLPAAPRSAAIAPEGISVHDMKTPVPGALRAAQTSETTQPTSVHDAKTPIPGALRAALPSPTAPPTTLAREERAPQPQRAPAPISTPRPAVESVSAPPAPGPSVSTTPAPGPAPQSPLAAAILARQAGPKTTATPIPRIAPPPPTTPAPSQGPPPTAPAPSQGQPSAPIAPLPGPGAAPSETQASLRGPLADPIEENDDLDLAIPRARLPWPLVLVAIVTAVAGITWMLISAFF